MNNSTLRGNIKKKLSIFEQQSNNYSMYVNIGGGVSSLGMGDDKDTLKVGLVNLLDIDLNFTRVNFLDYLLSNYLFAVLFFLYFPPIQ